MSCKPRHSHTSHVTRHTSHVAAAAAHGSRSSKQHTIDECDGINVHHTRDYATYLETLYLLRFAGLGRIVGDHLDSRRVPDGRAITAVRMPTTQHTPHHTTPHSKTRRSKPPPAVRSTAADCGSFYGSARRGQQAAGKTYVSEFAVSSALYSEGDTFTNIRVFALPPRPSCNGERKLEAAGAG